MAFNWQTFRIRTITTILFAIIMLGGVLWNQWSFLILFSIIHFGCWYDYHKLVGQIDPGYKGITPFHQYVFMLAGWCLMLSFTGDSYIIFGWKLHVLSLWAGSICIFLLLLNELLFTRPVQVKNIGHSALGLLYISLSLGLIMDMRKDYFLADIHVHYPVAPQWHLMVMPCIIIFSIWVNDTLAYLVGSMIGKTPLTKISPKKTWEGTLGGVLLTVLIAGIMAWQFDFDTRNVLLISAITCIAGTFGDILESKLKRMAGIKDSGSIFPGHGGFLDRFDSLLVAIPVVWLVYGAAYYFSI